MNDNNLNTIPKSFWITSAFMLLWNIGGSINFIMQMNPENISKYQKVEQAIIVGRPLWATIGFGVCVFAGAIGCVFLLLKKSLAHPLFIVSLVGVLVTMVHTVSIDYDWQISHLIMMVLMPIAVACFLVWYANLAKIKNWIT